MKPHEAIQHFRTQAKLAKSLGLAQSTVAEWVSNDEIPLPRQYQIELATSGKLQADVPALRVQEAA